jgi:hypothetical protein
MDDDDAFQLQHLSGAQRDIDGRGYAIQCVVGDADHLAFSYGEVLEDRIAGREMRVMEVLDSREHLLSAHVHARTAGPLPALQAIYPDIYGVWPWQPGSRIANGPLLGAVPDPGGAGGPGR